MRRHQRTKEHILVELVVVVQAVPESASRDHCVRSLPPLRELRVELRPEIGREGRPDELQVRRANVDGDVRVLQFLALPARGDFAPEQLRKPVERVPHLAVSDEQDPPAAAEHVPELLPAPPREAAAGAGRLHVPAPRLERAAAGKGRHPGIVVRDVPDRLLALVHDDPLANRSRVLARHGEGLEVRGHPARVHVAGEHEPDGGSAHGQAPHRRRSGGRAFRLLLPSASLPLPQCV